MRSAQINQLCFFQYLFLLGILLTSCKSIKEISGTYKLESDQPVSIHLSLNDDGTFVEYIHGDVCKEHYYFGYYSKTGRKIKLNPISRDFSYLGKKDVVVYNFNALQSGNSVFVYLNQQKPLENAKVFLDSNSFVTTDERGFASIPNFVSSDSIKIQAPIGRLRVLPIDKEKKYNQLFVMIYDYNFEPCGDFFFWKDLIVADKNSLSLFRDKRGSRGENGKYFKRITR